MSVHEKEEILKDYLSSVGKVAVAFSGGVDSTFLLKVAKDTLGENVIALTAKADWVPEREILDAENFCKKLGARHIVVNANMHEIPHFRENPKDRCYFCKKALFQKFKEIAKEEGGFTLAEGSNMDDNGDYRPGMKAVEEIGAISPLQYAGLYKKEIRQLSKEMNLDTWDKPSFACLASRIPYGDEITSEKLAMVDLAEIFLMEHGFSQFRVRAHGALARIELLKEEMKIIMCDDFYEQVSKKFKQIGFDYVALDLEGYRTGSMNEVLKIHD